MGERPGPSSSDRRLRVEVADGRQETWIEALLDDVAAERGWSIAGDAPATAVVVVTGLETTVAAGAEPLLVVRVEDGTSRSPAVAASAPDLPIHHELVVGAFKARRSQRVTRAALEQFLERVERARPTARPEPDGPDRPDRPDRPDERSEIRHDAEAVLAAVNAWLARTTMTPEAAQAIGADRAILAAAITAPEIDRVIVDRVIARLTALLEA